MLAVTELVAAGAFVVVGLCALTRFTDEAHTNATSTIQRVENPDKAAIAIPGRY